MGGNQLITTGWWLPTRYQYANIAHSTERTPIERGEFSPPIQMMMMLMLGARRLAITSLLVNRVSVYHKGWSGVALVSDSHFATFSPTLFLSSTQLPSTQLLMFVVDGPVVKLTHWHSFIIDSLDFFQFLLTRLEKIRFCYVFVFSNTVFATVPLIVGRLNLIKCR